jgi:hypothetical protein
MILLPPLSGAESCVLMPPHRHPLSLYLFLLTPPGEDLRRGSHKFTHKARQHIAHLTKPPTRAPMRTRAHQSLLRDRTHTTPWISFAPKYPTRHNYTSVFENLDADRFFKEWTGCVNLSGCAFLAQSIYIYCGVL